MGLSETKPIKQIKLIELIQPDSWINISIQNVQGQVGDHKNNSHKQTDAHQYRNIELDG
jgi:hypothetical protein